MVTRTQKRVYGSTASGLRPQKDTLNLFSHYNMISVFVVVVVAVLIFTLTRIIKSVVTGQAPVTLE